MSDKTFQIVGDDLSDGYHTFTELYDHRHALFLNALKAGAFEDAFYVPDHYEGWDLVVAFTKRDPHTYLGHKQISYHLPNVLRSYYEDLPRKEKHDSYDNHKSSDVLTRLFNNL